MLIEEKNSLGPLLGGKEKTSSVSDWKKKGILGTRREMI